MLAKATKCVSLARHTLDSLPEDDGAAREHGLDDVAGYLCAADCHLDRYRSASHSDGGGELADPDPESSRARSTARAIAAFTRAGFGAATRAVLPACGCGAAAGAGDLAEDAARKGT